MGMFLIILVISLIVAGIGYVVSYESEKIETTISCFIITTLICCLLPFGILIGSYSTYVDIRAKYDATISQYRDSITMYKNNATIDVKKASFTDFKYEGYQENIASFIKTLRWEVVNYNKTLIGKRILNKNFFFSWIIIEPDPDMKILRLDLKEDEE